MSYPSKVNGLWAAGDTPKLCSSNVGQQLPLQHAINCQGKCVDDAADYVNGEVQANAHRKTFQRALLIIFFAERRMQNSARSETNQSACEHRNFCGGC